MSDVISAATSTGGDDVRAAPLNGLDFVEVTAPISAACDVFFLGRAPRDIAAANVRITGGAPHPRRAGDGRSASIARTIRRSTIGSRSTSTEAGDLPTYTLLSLVDAR